jgi:CheY-like chemotaxis protein
MREMPGFQSVPVIFLTGSDRVDDYRRSLGAGGSTYLTKPVGNARLQAAIEELLPQPVTRDEGGGD